ncbi:hypothetical protein [Rubinisphaera sp.]|uniref:hypothetical protein n=1 Tax=Rubinisphaera sp. TaxID=2024857 RepID=UPI0025DC740F|nr:hypothetical protein [Rubinisphaera sp.]|tara:strand:- start:2522 stop:3739 length:1218 start_codon:yes stop_codon:yes gene_type:complete
MKYYFLALGTLVVVCVGCAVDGQQVIDKGEYHAPPAAMMQRPGPMVDLPYPAIMPPLAPQPAEFIPRTSQVRFVGPAGMMLGWQIPVGFAENQMMAPGRYNFKQGATYRLKATNVPGREGLVLYPTLQVYPAHPTTDAYLTHNSIPLQITDEDLDQIETNNFVTKVIYLPEAKFQELAIAGVETLVSTRLDPGVDPVSEADRRGTIMAVMRIGNMDLEMPGQQDEMIQAVSHEYKFNGDNGKFIDPMPIGPAGTDSGMPNGMVMGGPGGPGMPAYNPVVGVGGAQAWGMPRSGTPIGLQGPPHLPYGGPASLKSHTIYNNTRYDVGQPVDHFVTRVRHEPGIRMPHPVKDVEYTEKHPVHGPNDLSVPAWYGGGPAGPGGYGPPQGYPQGGPQGTYCPPGYPQGQ